MSVDHVVIVVAELGIAVEAYRAMGFAVTPGGEHEGLGTHNALIVLDDDSYLELIAFRDPSAWRKSSSTSAVARRMGRWAVGEGLVDFALLPTQIAEDVEAARRRGLALEGPLEGGRLRPDGQRVAWQVAFPDGWDVPFLCGDVTARPLRAPTGAARQHANGAVGLLVVTVVVQEIERSVARYGALLGVEPEPGGAMFLVGGTTISLVSPRGSGDPLHERLAQQGEGPLALRLRTRDAAEARVLDPEETGGVTIELVHL